MSRTWFPRLSAAVLLSAFAFSSFVVAETGEGLTPSPVSMDRQAAAERQPSSITGVLMRARGGPSTAGGFLDGVNGVEKGTSDCCTEGGNGGVGCDDPTCEGLICGADSFCCDTAWDGICADAAQDQCAVCMGAPPPPESDCCEANGTPGCNDATCETDVCAQDAFCCDIEWDSVCADAAALLCEDCGGTPPEPEPVILVNTTADGSPADDGFCTLREAVMTANGTFFGFTMPGECETPGVKGLDGTVIGFDPSLAGQTISLNLLDVQDVPDKGGPDVHEFFGPSALVVYTNIIISADPDDGIIIERNLAGPEMRLFLILDIGFLEDLLFDVCKGGCKGFGSAGIEFENVTLQNGIARGGDGGDGGFNDGFGNKGGDPTELSGGGGGGAGGFGGAVLNVGGFVSFENSTLTNNQAIGGNGGTTGGAPVPKAKGTFATAAGAGGGGIGGDGDDGAFASGDGGGEGGGEISGEDGFFGGGGAGAEDFIDGGDGGSFGGGGGGGAVRVEPEIKGSNGVGLDVFFNDPGAGGEFGGGGGGAATTDVPFVKGGPSPGSGGFGGGDGSSQTGGGGGGMGGAVFTIAGVVTSVNSTFSGNSAVGGMGTDEPAPPKGETSAQGAGLGGGVFSLGGLVGINNSTFSDNQANDGGGGVFVLAGDFDFCIPDNKGGCIPCTAKGGCGCSGGLQAFNSIFAHSLNGATDIDSADVDDNGCVIPFEGDNLVIETPPLGKGATKGSNILNVDPELGALGDNGGPSDTHLPNPGSPVIDAVDTGTKIRVQDDVRLATKGLISTQCEDRDQRGVARNQLEECDMGSVEVLPGFITICKVEDPLPPEPKTLGWAFDGDLGFFGLNQGECTDPFEEAPGTYSVVEASNEPFFYLGAINCESDGTLDVSVDVPNHTVDITVVEDENVTCTFVNEQAGNITITKNTNVPTLELFGFNHDIPVPPPPKEGEKGPGPDFSLASGASEVFALIRPGSYAVSEIDPFPENFALDNIVCGGTSSGSGLTATINLAPGENVECFFNNVELEAQLSLDKNADGVPLDAFVGDQYVYHLVLTNNGPGFGTNVVVTDPLSPLLAFVSSACATEDPPGTVRWEVGTILAGQSLFCDFTVEILDIGFIENVAFADGDQGDGGGENEGSVTVKGATPTIPTLGPWALGLLALVLGFAGVARIRRR